jgi:hypothetical protein
VKGRPNVAENWEGNCSFEDVGSRAGKSGSRTRKEEGEAGGEADCRMAIVWGSIGEGGKTGEVVEREAGNGMLELVT